ncbi:MAG: alpha/beta hydrolase [Chloroflexia bacterium]
MRVIGRIRLLLTVVVLLVGAIVSGSVVKAQSNAVQRDVTYCTAGGVALKMDVYPPTVKGNGPVPVVMYVHGGGWVSGDKREIGLGAADLNALGFLVVSVNYRLAPEHKWPAQIEDVKCAVRYLRANAATYNLDPDRIGVWGSSAGGHLAALLGLTDSTVGFDGKGGQGDQSSKVQAVVDMFGPTDLLAYDVSGRATGLGSAVFGYEEGGPIDVLEKASPVNYVTGSAPPFLIIHGDKDIVVPVEQSKKLHDRLTAAGAQSTFVIVKNAGHAFVPATGKLQDLDPSIDTIKTLIPQFFDRELGSGRNAGTMFPETGKTVQGRFLQYWQANGGLPQFGYPISEKVQEKSDIDGKTYTVQYFERAVFEMHPENVAPNDVLLQLLGVFRFKEKYATGAPVETPNTAPGSVVFKETGKRVGGRFLEYWRGHGGIAQQGLPISDEFTEVSNLDGKSYIVQYFERAVFEHHPENAAPNDVLLVQLGTFRYRDIHASATVIGEKP